ncbi:TetR/AcrR family transcriptional regulator [Glutamicibacter uratoxydans]|uniref:TetR/AcrR family transcriptional regulator n=1 Tax=Glutamicibacter uratoxydans TaxID=43667 RepID=UPI003D6FF847
MSTSEDTANHEGSRDKERTRRALLDAATVLLSEYGAGVSMAKIAAQAKVSKGALTHHFPSREALEDAVVQDSIEQFWDEVHAQVDLAENRPGKLLRGYIRALTGDSEVIRKFYSPSHLIQILGREQVPHRLMLADAARWREAMTADGLDEANALTLRFAAEGLALSADSPYLTPEELKLARENLLRLADSLVN